MSRLDPEHVFRYTEEFSDTIITAARGACVYDREGREILDFTSGQMSAILGHAHPEIVAAASEAVTRLAHLHSSFLSDVVIDFADALSGLLLGVELVGDRHRKEPAHALGAAVGRRCIELGASLNIARQSSAHIFRIAPPLTVTREQIDTAMAILDQALTECVNP